MRLRGLMIASAALLSACATDSGGPRTSPVADNGNDCAVIAAVLRDYYRFHTTDNPAPTLWLAGEGWRPQCDWRRYEVMAREVRYGSPASTNMNWVSVYQPRYDGEGAVVHAGYRSGARVGGGVECRVRSGFAGWTATDCTDTWIY